MSGVVYTEQRPAPALAGVVRCYWSIEGVVPGGSSLRNRVLPDGCMDVIFNVGEEPSEGAGTFGEPGYVVGVMLEALVVGMEGRVDMIGVRFEPGAAGTYLGLPATELTARAIGFSALRRDAGTLAERVAESGGSAGPVDAAGSPVGAAHAARARLCQRASVLDSVLAAGRCAEPDALVAEAVRLIESTRGTMPVSRIETALDVSPRTLTRRFAAAVGITPKTASRIARLQAAASEIRRDPDGSLARIAIRSGFHDQPHLNRDFRDLARVTPAGYARESRDGFIQDDTTAGN